MAFHFDPRTHCQNLRCKEMYAREARDPEREAREAEAGGAGDTAAFWCLHTQTARGPDGARVTGTLCASGRVCFVGLEDLA
jgi:hypothetical protein